MREAIKKIVVIGPESTGKSTLCQMLAAHFNTLWVREYAREFLHLHGPQYKYDDLLEIAKGQLNLEDENLHQITGEQKLLIIDTDLNVIKIWSEFVFGKCEPWILEKIAERNYDLYLLCRNDIPWEYDELREYPDIASREQLYHIYKDHLVHQQVPWVEIGGTYSQRFEQARQAVEKLT